MSPQSRFLKLRLFLSALWVVVCFVLPWWSKYLDFRFFGWPFGFWWAAQGAVLCFVGIAAINAWFGNRLEALAESTANNDE